MEFNLNFHAPRKDACQKCDLLQLKTDVSSNEEEKLELQQNHDLHFKNAEQSRKCLNADQQTAKENPEKCYKFSLLI